MNFIPTYIPQNSVLQDTNRSNGKKSVHWFGKGKHLSIQYDEVCCESPSGRFSPRCVCLLNPSDIFQSPKCFLGTGRAPIISSSIFYSPFFGSLQTYCRVLINVSDSRYMSLSVFMCHIVVY